MPDRRATGEFVILRALRKLSVCSGVRHNLFKLQQTRVCIFPKTHADDNATSFFLKAGLFVLN